MKKSEGSVGRDYVVCMSFLIIVNSLSNVVHTACFEAFFPYKVTFSYCYKVDS